MSQIFVGSQAVAAGTLTRHELRTHYERILPDIYLPKLTKPSLADRTVGTWLWSQRQGIISGLAASAMHGAKWVDDGVPIEVNWPDRKAPTGVVVRADTLLPEEIVECAGLLVTSVERTAFDLARQGPLWRAVERLDALAAANEPGAPSSTDPSSIETVTMARVTRTFAP